MGTEIDNTHFRHKDFQRFSQNLTRETELLDRWFRDGNFEDKGKIGGFELEICLVDDQAKPMPVNDRYLAISEQRELPVVCELSKFNLELNSEPRALHGDVFSRMFDELNHSWSVCGAVARQVDANLMMVGILQSLPEEALSLENMSQVRRFRALNEQVLRLREGQPLRLDIEGRRHLRTYHTDVMLESAATSFQLHVQMPPEQAVRYFNAAHILSAPMVAVTANSPYLFGFDLWDETRIPLFEQAVSVGGGRTVDGCELGRVSFGAGYADSSLFECFAENLSYYPVLLPAPAEEEDAQMHHVRLHNGTIWRWNRPLIGFNGSGRPHVRLEHRVIPAGPTVVDMIANAALFYGLVEVMAADELPPESLLDFGACRHNFYQAARHGLDSRITWLGGKEVNMFDLLMHELLPIARRGLERLEVDGADIRLFLGVIEGRLRNKRTGAAWQRDYVARHGDDMQALAMAYMGRQNGGEPVHEWRL